MQTACQHQAPQDPDGLRSRLTPAEQPVAASQRQRAAPFLGDCGRTTSQTDMTISLRACHKTQRGIARDQRLKGVLECPVTLLRRPCEFWPLRSTGWVKSMAENSAIEWTHTTWNPVTGCTKVGPGCDNCYAERFAERWRGVPDHPYEQGFDLRLWPTRLRQPFLWKKPRMIFVNSMSDLFHKEVDRSFIDRGLRCDGGGRLECLPSVDQAQLAHAHLYPLALSWGSGSEPYLALVSRSRTPHMSAASPN